MYFNFSELSKQREKTVEQYKLFSPWAQLTSFQARLSSIIGSAALPYAEAYALVQQSEYDKDGHVKDVTSDDRLTVPTDTLYGVREQLRKLQADMDMAIKPEGTIVGTGVGTGSASQVALEQFDIAIGNVVHRVDMKAGTITPDLELGFTVSGSQSSGWRVSVDDRISIPIAASSDERISYSLAAVPEIGFSTNWNGSATYTVVRAAVVSGTEVIIQFEWLGNTTSAGQLNLFPKITIRVYSLGTPNSLVELVAIDNQAVRGSGSYSGDFTSVTKYDRGAISYTPEAADNNPLVSTGQWDGHLRLPKVGVSGTVSGEVTLTATFEDLLSKIDVQSVLDTIQVDE